MLFNSFEYYAFLLLVAVVFHGFLKTVRARNWLLLAAGSIFYASWSPAFLLLLYATIGVDYLVGRALEARVEPGTGRRILIASFAVNLGVLAFFKYTDFLLGSAEQVATILGRELDLPRLNVPLPLGISFYTFLSLSYTLDVYRRVCRAEASLLRYGVFVTFFPHLIAGPILRGGEFLPQVAEPRAANLRIWWGLNLIFVGLAKKALLADWLGRLVNPVYGNIQDYDSVSCLLATYFYAFQIYFDFSGYVDIAFGSAALLGYELPANFDRPYLASDITGFWRRWHITLSRWLRDYVYIPLGGNRLGRARTYLNLLLTMLIGGLWHGPSWNFVIWGGLHGGLLAGHKFLRELRPGTPLPAPWKTVLLFQLVCLAWIFFRQHTFGGAWLLVGRIAALPLDAFSGRIPVGRLALALLASPVLLAAYAGLSRLKRNFCALAPDSTSGAYAYGTLVACLLAVLSAATAPPFTFIYFVF